MDSLKKVVIYIPAFNEEDNIDLVIDKLSELYSAHLTEPKGYIAEIIVVNDGSTDNTEIRAKAKGVKVISHNRNLGLGGASRTALETAYEMGADVAVKFDADLQYYPSDIEKVIMPLLEGKADICWGSRMRGKINYKMPYIRYVGNKFFTWLLNRLTSYNISDAQSGLKAFNRKFLAVFEIPGNYNSNQQLLIDANNKHMKYTEVPVTFDARTKGKSFVSLKYPFRVLPNIIRVLIYANPLKIFGFLGLFLTLASILIVAIWLVFHYLNIQIFFPRNISLLLFLSGLQIMFFGILADLIVKKRK